MSCASAGVVVNMGIGVSNDLAANAIGADRSRIERADVPIVHFVRFASLSDQSYANAVRMFGPPDFMHRVWDQRAQREISEGDIVVFATGDAGQPVTPFNRDDEFYSVPRIR